METSVRETGPQSGALSHGERWRRSTIFVLSHLAVLGAFWSGVTWESVVLCFVLLVVRVWGITAGYHRYFSHRTYKTSRAFQFFLALLAQSSSQKGVLWWAAHHRVHHKLSDQPGDVHSPVQNGFIYSHVGWIFDDTEETRWDKIRDFAKYPELRWLNRWHWVPPAALGVACFLAGGWSALVVGFFLSTVLCWHGTYTINSLTHLFGRRRYVTTDTSRNSLVLALVTFGEGWHNNHHYYQSTANQGFFWWEIDISYYVLRLLSLFGLVRDLRTPPAHVLAANRIRDGHADIGMFRARWASAVRKTTVSTPIPASSSRPKA